jgi:hypothetical protein
MSVEQWGIKQALQPLQCLREMTSHNVDQVPYHSHLIISLITDNYMSDDDYKSYNITVIIVYSIEFSGYPGIKPGTR